MGSPWESEPDVSLPMGPEMLKLCVSVYWRCLENGSYDEKRLSQDLDTSSRALAVVRTELVRLRLLRATREETPKLVPVSPDIAEAELLEPWERHLQEQRTELAETRERIQAHRSAHLAHLKRQGLNPGVLVLEDVEEVRHRIRLATQNCLRQAATMQPGGGRSAEYMEKARQQDIQMAERGVRIRVLYQHTARSNLATQAYVRQLTQVGGEVRTTDEIFERLIIFDDDLVFIPDLGSGERGPGAIMVTDPSIVAFLCRLHEHVWETAIPFVPIGAEVAVRLDKVHLAVARLLGGGHTDEVIARRLGMSSRTCRRYIAELLLSLDSSSRFQAGAAAARMGLLDMPDAFE